MTLFRTVDPAVEPVTIAEAKAHLRLDHDSEDELIAGLIRAAREEVERATGLAMIDQSWRLALDAVPASGLVLLRRHPVKAIVSVTVYDADGAASLVDPADYQLDGNAAPARLLFDPVPRPEQAMNGVEIDFSAGYGEAGTDVPDLARRAMLMLVAHWFEFRASFGAGEQPVGFPNGYERLIAGYRMARL